ncbi:red chlorophyll catabolite reductase, chloroplastic-like [Chenopodium quinoa]|uniref:Red chlorophyll catabolite reductase n=1 Tax=Chenopodium quinoa TaxID=63459 RepID=A0A803KXX0_CHEQI|nr:red chlorophyll catabolite reductase, chloroplastic-like [Chenopodium quinoa]
MALIFSHFPFSLPSKASPFCQTSLPSLPNFRFPTSTLTRSSVRSSMDSDGRPGFKDFPYASPPIKDLMIDLISTVENRLDSLLLPCTLPQDVQYFENQSGTAHASLLLRSGAPSSSIDFMLSSWLHCELPTGAALNITSLSSYMNSSTDAPHLVIEFIQSSPTSLVLILDLPPRKDLILHPEYLKTFYEDTQLEKQRQVLDKISEAQLYVSPSLYIRSVFSPTAVVLRVDTSSSGGDRLEQILRDDVSNAAQEVLNTWLSLCALGEKQDIGDDEKACLKKRDSLYKSKSIETDIGSSLPRMFGQEKADRVLEVLQAIL